MGVAEDHMLGFDAEPLDHLSHRRQSGAGDRPGGEVGANGPEAEPVGEADGARHRDGAEQPASKLGAGGVAGPDRVPDPRRRVAGAALSAGALGKREQQRVHRRLSVLVGDRVDPPRALLGSVRGGLERVRSARANAQQALDRGDTEALERGDGEVAVEVVAVGRVDIVAQPDPRIGDLDRGAGELANQRRQRRRLGLDALLEPERWLALEQASLEPGLDEMMVVVAGDDDQLPFGHGLGQLAQKWLGERERLIDRAVAQLDQIAEQDDAVARFERLEQRRAKRRAAQQVAASAGAEMKVGDDDGAHRPILAGAAPVPTVAPATIGR